MSFYEGISSDFFNNLVIKVKENVILMSLLQKSRPFLRHDYRFVLPMRICSTEDSHQNLA
jgi:hypothetical protein